jgi:hypothetical protein
MSRSEEKADINCRTLTKSVHLRRHTGTGRHQVNNAKQNDKDSDTGENLNDKWLGSAATARQKRYHSHNNVNADHQTDCRYQCWLLSFSHSGIQHMHRRMNIWVLYKPPSTSSLTLAVSSLLTSVCGGVS